MVIFVCGLLQATLLDTFRIFNVKPDLLLITAVLAGLFFREGRWALGLSLFAGMIKDLLCVNSAGVNTLLFPLWTLLVIRLSRKITIDTIPLRVACVFAVALMNDISARLIFLFLGNFSPAGAFLRVIFLEPFYTALVAFLILTRLDPVFKKD